MIAVFDRPTAPETSVGASRGGQTECARLGCDLGASFRFRPGERFDRVLTAWQESGVIEAFMQFGYNVFRAQLK
ncbi:hypothetical protein EAH80_30200 [Mycobacterium hodleri]|uniref:Uncharacterized protein n=1 Tax=Mycolicibacterium hodleri TaxID=49897 RepID=A0A502DJV6_9MYCO|nr:hypothetical protein EAH80_30200 [Mycolicibacterium hodleri]